jgi:putative cardiolipin synthase
MASVGRHDVRAVVLRAHRRALRKRVLEVERTDWARELDESPLAVALRAREVELHWANGQVLVDPPDKLAQPPDAAGAAYLGSQLTRHADRARSELLLVSSYFVPAGGGVEYFGARCRDGVRVRLLTNSLAATDVWLVHAGYRKYRRALLERGVEIHELKPHGRPTGTHRRRGGSSRASLHAKTFVVDRRAVFVGSLNIDPRSLAQNTEVGVLVDSAELAAEVVRRFERWTDPAWSYRVTVAGRRLSWTATEDGLAARWSDEPGAGFWRRLGARVVSHLPIESQV